MIFFTDGEDTCNSKDSVDKSVDNLRNLLNGMRGNLKSRFLTIGFSSGHDAPLMNKIAQSGTDLGNFMYIDTDRPNYADDVQSCFS